MKPARLRSRRRTEADQPHTLPRCAHPPRSRDGDNGRVGHSGLFLAVVCLLIYLNISGRGICAAPARAIMGKAHPAAIIIGAKASEVERFAAAELQSYLAEITSARFPIFAEGQSITDSAVEIVIGRPETNIRIAQLSENLRLDRTTLGEDGYVIKTLPNHERTVLVLSGAHDRSSLFAVYHFLETRGVGFFGYRSRGGEVVPHQDEITLPALDIIERPAMNYRFVSDNGFSAADKSKFTAIADWGAKNRCNAYMITPSRPGETWEQIALDEARKRGLTIAGPGHVLSRLTPARELFTAHPEYFPLLGGERKTTYSETWGGATAFCYSNPEAMRIFVNHAVQYVEQNPWLEVFALYPPDGSQHGVQCQCEHCAKLGVSDWYLTLINNVTAALAARHAAVKVMWIAYNECGVPPRQVRPFDHGRSQVLFWCNDVRNHLEPMDSPGNRVPAPYLEWKPRLKAIKTDFMKNPGAADLAATPRWEKWKAFLTASDFQGDVVLLEYYNQHAANSLQVHWLRYCQSGPWPAGVMPRDFQFYTAQGISGWQNCTDYFNDAPNPYWNYLNAQMMWNPRADLTAIDARFYRSYYGAAGAVMQEYFTALWCEIACLEVSPAAVARVVALERLLRDAEEASKTSANADIATRLKAARAFQTHCVAVKKQVLNDYHPDGSPKHPGKTK